MYKNKILPVLAGIGLYAATMGSAYANDAVTNRGEAVVKIFPGTVANAPHHLVKDGIVVGGIEAVLDLASTFFRGVIGGQKTSEICEYSLESGVVKDIVEKVPGSYITANAALGGIGGAVAGHNVATIFNHHVFGNVAGEGFWAGLAIGGGSAVPGEVLREE